MECKDQVRNTVFIGIAELYCCLVVRLYWCQLRRCKAKYQEEKHFLGGELFPWDGYCSLAANQLMHCLVVEMFVSKGTKSLSVTLKGTMYLYSTVSY